MRDLKINLFTINSKLYYHQLRVPIIITWYDNTITVNVYIPSTLLIVNISQPLIVLCNKGPMIIVVCNKGSHGNVASMMLSLVNTQVWSCNLINIKVITTFNLNVF